MCEQCEALLEENAYLRRLNKITRTVIGHLRRKQKSDQLKADEWFVALCEPVVVDISVEHEG